MVHHPQPSLQCLQQGHLHATLSATYHTRNKVHYNDELLDLFKESKRFIISEIDEGVKIFYFSQPTCLATDWSKTGIGFQLLPDIAIAQASNQSANMMGGRSLWKAAVSLIQLNSSFSLSKKKYLFSDLLWHSQCPLFVFSCHNLIIHVCRTFILRIVTHLPCRLLNVVFTYLFIDCMTGL